MAISNNIAAKVALMIEEQKASEENEEAPTPIGDEIAEKAIKAILGGVQDWVAYVSLFSTNDAELARLMPTNGTSEAENKLNEVRAYLAAEGMCGMGTGKRLGVKLTTKLD